MLLHSCNLRHLAKVVSVCLYIPQIKIIITAFKTKSNPLQHVIFETTKTQKFS